MHDFEEHDYKSEFISDRIIRILNDMELESSDGIYETPDDRKFYMGYFAE